MNKKRKRELKLLFNPVSMVSIFIGLLISVATPELLQISWIRQYTAFVAPYMPLIEEHVEHSAFPSTTRLYLSFAWPLYFFQVPILIHGWISLEEEETIKRFKYTGKKLPISKKIGIPFSFWAPFMLLILYGITVSGFYLGKDPSFCAGCTSANRLGMTILWSIGMPLMMTFCIAMSYIWLKNFKKIYFEP